MASTTDNVNVKVTLEDTQKFVADANKGTQSVEKLGKEVREVDEKAKRAGRGLGIFGRGLGLAGKAGNTAAGAFKRAAVTAGGFIVAIAGISQIKKSIDVTQEVAIATLRLNRNFGLTTKTASQWAIISKRMGLDNKKVALSFTQISKQMLAARRGNETAIKTFDQLGIRNKDLVRGSKDFNFILMRVADGLQRVRGGAARAEMAQKILGKSGADLMPLFSGGSEAIKENFAMMEKYGAFLEGKSARQIKDFILQKKEMDTAILGIRLSLGQKLMPVIIKFYAFVGDLIYRLRFGGGAFAELRDRADKLKDSFAEMFAQGMKGEGALGVLRTRGIQLGAIIAKLVDLLSRHKKVAAALTSTVISLYVAYKAFTIGKSIYTTFTGMSLAMNKAKNSTIALRIQLVLLAAKEKALALWAERARAKLIAQRAATWLLNKANIASTISTAAFALKTKLLAFWSAVVARATKIWAGAQALLNIAMTANPIGVIIVGVAALAAAFVLAYKKITWFRNGVNRVFDFVKKNWRKMLFPVAPFLAIVVTIIANWNKIKKAMSSMTNWIRDKWRDTLGLFRGTAGKIKSIGSTMWEPVREGFKTVINWVIDKWNSLRFEIPEVDIPGLGKVGGGSIGTPHIDKIGGSTPTSTFYTGKGPKKTRSRSVTSKIASGLSNLAPSGGMRSLAMAAETPVDITLKLDGEVLARHTSKHKRIIADAVNDVARDKKARS